MKKFGIFLAWSALFLGALVLAAGLATWLGDQAAREALPDGWCHYETGRTFPAQTSVKIALRWKPGVGNSFCPTAGDLVLSFADTNKYWKDLSKPFITVLGLNVRYRDAAGNFHDGVAAFWVPGGIGKPKVEMLEKPLVFTGYK